MCGNDITGRLAAMPGDASLYYKDLLSGDTVTLAPDRPLLAASVIKLPMMVEAFRQFSDGTLDSAQPVTVRAQDKVPSCGVLTYLHDGLTVTVRDLVTLAIIVSDNTATNLLMDLLTIDRVNALLDSLHMPITRLRRKMFDSKAAARGLQNHITAGEIGRLLEMLYREEIVTPQACRDMLQILRDQQLNSKIPFRFEEKIEIAHKTGEDDGITHDVSIVYAEKPFILCVCGNNVDVTALNRSMQNIAWEIANDS